VLRWAIETWRREGARVLWFSILGETVYRRLLLFEVRTAEQPEPPATLRLLEPTSVATAAEHLPHVSRKVVANRLRRGDRCFCALKQGQVVAYRWLATDKAPVDYLGCALELTEGVVYFYDAYTVPDARGAGVSGALFRAIAKRLAADGCHTAVAAILPENRAARRAAGKIPYRRVGRFGYVQLGPWRKYFLRSRTSSVALAAENGLLPRFEAS
jgi:hypothetical protein